MSLGINNRNDSLDLLKLEEMAWLVAFLGRAGSEKKRHKTHWDRSDKTADGTNPRELQRTKFFLSQRGVQAILKLRSLVLQKKPLWDDVQWDPQCGTRKLQTQTTFIVAERTMFPSAVQNQGDCNLNFLGRLLDAPRYSTFSKFKNTADAKDEMIRMNFISGLRSADCKHKLVEAAELK